MKSVIFIGILYQVTLKPQYLIPVMSTKQRLGFIGLVSLWLVALGWFLHWWFLPGHVVSVWGLVLTSVVLFWELALPGYFFYFVGRMRRTNPALALPNVRVAMVVTKAPSEPFSVVQKTLRACLTQEPAHETWLADEDPTQEVYAWCAKYGVQVCTRKGVAEYHQLQWPRRTKCKEGNLAYFYDKHGYELFDVVVQLDADHVPAAGYLEAMVRPFADPGVGYVSAPSICDANAAQSWSARGRLYAESIMHGPLQAGHNNLFFPLCIGSHYAVRTSALRVVGGLGPELAEDHSTTLLLASAGWRGVHALDAIAHGDGPATFSDAMVQEFQWSRSLAVLLLTLTPKLFLKLPLRGKIQFLFAQLWYPLFALTMLVGVALPVVAIVFKQSLANVSYVAYLVYSLPIHVLVLGISMFLRRGGWLRPYNAPVLSWEAILFHITRWPWALYGTVAAAYVVWTKKSIVFKVTPKGTDVHAQLPKAVLLPYGLVVLGYLLVLLIAPEYQTVAGYYFFSIVSVVSYTLVLFVLPLLHRREARALSRTRVHDITS